MNFFLSKSKTKCELFKTYLSEDANASARDDGLEVVMDFVVVPPHPGVCHHRPYRRHHRPNDGDRYGDGVRTSAGGQAVTAMNLKREIR